MNEVIFDDAPFFAPVSTDLIDSLLGQYDQAKSRIESVAAFIMSEEYAKVTQYFIDGNTRDSNDRYSLDIKVAKLFELKGAIGSLNAAYWAKALNLTDVIDLMPQARRDQWHEQIRNPLGKKAQRNRGFYVDENAKEWDVEPLPDFKEEVVRSTIENLLNMRAQFVSERVDGIFRGLSGDHVTNAPEAFGKRMIIARVLNAYDFAENSTCGLINDLRCVIAKFMGREEPKHGATSFLVDQLKMNWGEWTVIDGGALKIRLYKKGTAHLEIHPDMAWRLNRILSFMHPAAIPAEFRQKPKKKAKDYVMMSRPLPFAVLNILSSARYEMHGKNTAYLERFNNENKPAYEEAGKILESIGGVFDGTSYCFDYHPRRVIGEIVVSGCIPDQKSHQFYPTPERLAKIAIDLACIDADHQVLEPSAGTGNIANLLPKERTKCIEISKLHADILKAKGFDVLQEDFLACNASPEFDRVVMNPPYSEGRWLAHIKHASGYLKQGGKLVAILPSSAKNKDLISGFETNWHGPFDNEFDGTSISVVIMVSEKV